LTASKLLPARDAEPHARQGRRHAQHPGHDRPRRSRCCRRRPTSRLAPATTRILVSSNANAGVDARGRLFLTGNLYGVNGRPEHQRGRHDGDTSS
jgi:hypothetical protein